MTNKTTIKPRPAKTTTKMRAAAKPIQEPSYNRIM